MMKTNHDLLKRAAEKLALFITEGGIGNIIFELDEACAALKLTEDEHKFAVAAVVAAWETQRAAKNQK